MFSRKSLWLAFLGGVLLSGSPVQALSRQSTGSGNWSNAASWSPAGVPGAGDDVTVNFSHVITVDTLAAQASSVLVNGTLRFSRSTSSALLLTAGDVTLHGLLDMGTALDPISLSTVTATLTLASGEALSIAAFSDGVFRAHGAVKSPVAEAITGAAAGAVSVLVPAAGAVGWQAGDWITIGQTDNPDDDQTEMVQISTITGTDPLTVAWTGGLSFSHGAAGPTRVGNLTRNVAVRGTGPTPGGIDMTGPSSGDFQALWAEFSGLERISFTGAADDAVFTGASIHHGAGDGLSFNNTDRQAVTDTLIYKSADHGVNLSDCDDTLVRGSDIYAGNASNDPTDRAIQALFSTSDVIEGNHFYSNTGDVLFLESDGAVVQDNRIYANDGDGMVLSENPGVVVAGNMIYRNGGTGIVLFDGAGRSLIASNEIFGNDAGVIATDGAGSGSGGDVLLANTIYNNTVDPSGGGVSLNIFNADQEYFLQDNRLGYDKAGVSRPNVAEIKALAGSGRKTRLHLRGNRVNPVVPLALSSFLTTPDNYFVSYNQEFSTGTVQVYGDYLVAGGVLALDNGLPLYVSSATAVRLQRGAGHGASVVPGAGAVTQLITIRCVDGPSNEWQVEGSESGLLHGPFTGGVTAQDIGGQFTLSFSPGGFPRTDDFLAFGLMAASADAGVRKRLLFGNAGAGFNGGKSRLTVAPGAGLALRGTASLPALMDRVSGTGNYYTVVSSGAFTLVNGQVLNADKDGLQLSGTGGVLLSSSTFNAMGVAAGQTSAYVTARGLTSSATFYNMTFGVSRSTAGAAGAFAVQVQGSDAGLDWFFWGHNGGLDVADLDPNDKVRWSESVPPSTPGLFAAAPGAGEGEISLSWTSPGDDGLTGNIVGGGFLIFRSTVAAAAALATSGQAQTVISTNAAPGAAQALVVSGLALGTTQYFRLWAADEFNNISTAPAAATALPRRLTPLAAPFFSAAGAVGQVTLTWSDPLIPPLAYRDPYRLEASTVSSGGPFTLLASVPAADTGFLHTGVLLGTTYYYRLYTVDVLGGGAGTSAPAATSAQTADVSAPQIALSVGPRTVGVAWSPSMTLSFTKPMVPASVAGAITLRRLRDSLGNTVSESPLTVTLSSNAAGDAYVLSGPALAPNSRYELRVTTAAVDQQQAKPLGAEGLLRWTTLLDHTAPNVVVDDASGARLEVPALALPSDGYVESAAPAGAAAATQKLLANTGDALRSPLSGTVVGLEAFDAVGAPQAFSGQVTISFPYADAAPFDGVVDGTRVKADTLAVHWLDEVHNLWVRLLSMLDASAGVVSARPGHFTAFALIGQASTDLSQARAFPVPWRPSGGGLTFTDVGQTGTIQIFTPEGALVKEIPIGSGGQETWDGANSDGRPVATGVYFYRVSSGDAVKRGKLVVIR